MLFACRVVLNENELLYPFHKWLLEETRRAPRQPEGFMALLDALMAAPTMAAAQALSDRVFAFAGRAEKETDWPNQFMRDSELNWLEHERRWTTCDRVVRARRRPRALLPFLQRLLEQAAIKA